VLSLLPRLLRSIVLLVAPNSDRLRTLAYKPKFESWRKMQFGKHPIFENRTQMYDYINDQILKNSSIQYLEFGVFQGESIKYFSSINSATASRFIGFDTFEGLPEDWTEFSRTVKSKTFSTDGKAPEIADTRVSFVKGLFQDTLPKFLKDIGAPLQVVIHNDSDLYSATMYVLTCGNEIIVPGTIIIFDEFYSPMHEFRALDDYCSSYMRRYEVIAATIGHGKVAIRLL